MFTKTDAGRVYCKLMKANKHFVLLDEYVKPHSHRYASHKYEIDKVLFDSIVLNECIKFLYKGKRIIKLLEV